MRIKSVIPYAILCHWMPQKNRRLYRIWGSLDGEDYTNLRILFNIIWWDIANYDKTSIAAKLVSLGMDELFAALLVDEMIKQVPPFKYYMREISKMPDADFESKFPLVFKYVFVERVDPEKLPKILDVTPNLVSVMISVTRTFMNDLARGTATEKMIVDLCKSSGLSDSKIDVITKDLIINSEFWYKTLMFSNTQDASSVLEDIKIRVYAKSTLGTPRT